jgi:hypothetical protein
VIKPILVPVVVVVMALLGIAGCGETDAQTSDEIQLEDVAREAEQLNRSRGFGCSVAA